MIERRLWFLSFDLEFSDLVTKLKKIGGVNREQG